MSPLSSINYVPVEFLGMTKGCVKPVSCNQCRLPEAGLEQYTVGAKIQPAFKLVSQPGAD